MAGLERLSRWQTLGYDERQLLLAALHEMREADARERRLAEEVGRLEAECAALATERNSLLAAAEAPRQRKTEAGTDSVPSEETGRFT